MSFLDTMKTKKSEPLVSNPRPVSFLNSMQSQTPINTSMGGSTQAVADSSTINPIQTVKDVFTSADNTTGGVIRNTVTGLWDASKKVGKDFLTGMKDMVVNPSEEQKNYEATVLPRATNPIIKMITDPGITTARFISRVINPGLQPLANDLADIQAINEKGGIADMIAKGELPASYLDEIGVLQKTAPQIVGDVIQAVLTAYAGGASSKALTQPAKNTFLNTMKSNIKTGFSSGLQVGETLGVGQALSSGTKNPLEFAGTVGLSGLGGSIIGSILSGTIPVSKEFIGKVKEAKVLYDTMTPAQKQAGFIKNPLTKEVSTKVETSESRFNPDKYVEELVAKGEEYRKGEAKTLGEKTKDFIKLAKTKVVDSFSPIEDLLYTTVKKNKIELRPTQDIHNRISRVLRSDNIAGEFMKEYGLEKLIQDVPDINKFGEYVKAKHAIELDTRGKSTGLDLTKSEMLVRALSDEYEPYAKQIKNYSNKLLDYSVEAGLISKQFSENLRKLYPDYVPFDHIMNEIENKPRNKTGSGAASISEQTVYQKIQDSTSPIENPLSSLRFKTSDAIRQGERNKTARLLASYESLPGNPFELRKLEPDELVGTKHTISFLDNGETKIYETSPDIAIAAKALDKEQMNIIIDILRLPVRIARVGITGANPSFVMANVAKDAIGVFINSKHALKTSIANPENFFKSMIDVITHNKKYHEMVKYGGGGTSYEITRGSAKETVAKIRSRATPGKAIIHTVTHPLEWLRTIEDIFARGEEFTRQQQYSGTKEVLKSKRPKGWTDADIAFQAARDSQEASVDFSRGGDWGSEIGAIWLYMRAGIQGSRTLVRNLKQRPIQTIAKIAMVAYLPMATATAWNLSDPKRKEIYDKLSEYEKENNMIIVPPWVSLDEKTDKYNVIKIPLSPEISASTNIVRKEMESLYGGDPMTFEVVSNGLIGSFSPIQPGKVLSTIMPHALKPSVEVANNKNLFTGNKIVSNKNLELSPKNQFTDKTSGTLRLIGKELNVSPSMMEHWIKGTFGGNADLAINLVDSLMSSMGKIPVEQIGGKTLLESITGRFGKASYTKVDEKEYDEMLDDLMLQADARNEVKLNAIKIVDILSTLNKDAAIARLKLVAKDDPKLAEKVIELIAQKQMNYTPLDSLLSAYGVENGERAKKIVRELNKYKTPEEKKVYLLDLVKKKLVSDTVMVQIASLLKQK